MSEPQLPADVDAFMDFIGGHVAQSGCLAWEERARIKADMKNVGHRWYASRVTPDALRAKCVAVGMRENETADVLSWLKSIQSGQQVRPEYHRNFRWRQEPTDAV